MQANGNLWRKVVEISEMVADAIVKAKHIQKQSLTSWPEVEDENLKEKQNMLSMF